MGKPADHSHERQYVPLLKNLCWLLLPTMISAPLALCLSPPGAFAVRKFCRQSRSTASKAGSIAFLMKWSVNLLSAPLCNSSTHIEGVAMCERGFVRRIPTRQNWKEYARCVTVASGASAGKLTGKDMVVLGERCSRTLRSTVFTPTNRSDFIHPTPESLVSRCSAASGNNKQPWACDFSGHDQSSSKRRRLAWEGVKPYTWSTISGSRPNWDKQTSE